jgi:hypothetical protein
MFTSVWTRFSLDPRGSRQTCERFALIGWTRDFLIHRVTHGVHRLRNILNVVLQGRIRPGVPQHRLHVSRRSLPPSAELTQPRPLDQREVHLPFPLVAPPLPVHQLGLVPHRRQERRMHGAKSKASRMRWCYDPDTGAGSWYSSTKTGCVPPASLHCQLYRPSQRFLCEPLR